MCHGKNIALTLEDYNLYIQERYVTENIVETCNCQASDEEEVTLKVIDDFDKHLIPPFLTDDA